MTNDTSLESSCALLLESAKKFANLRKLKIESGSKQRFSLLQAKAVIQAVCLRTQAVSIKARFSAYREGFGYVGKVRKFQQPQTNTF